MKLSRFERKILVAIAAVAVVPLLGAVLLGQRALREAYEVGVNPRVRRELEHGLELSRAHFALLRRSADDLADAIAADYELGTALQLGAADRVELRLRELVSKNDKLARVRVVSASGDDIAHAEDGQRLGPTLRLLELERSIVGGRAGERLLLTVATPSAPFEAYQRAGELVEVFSRLQSSSALVSSFYLVVYMGFLLSVIVAALVVGMALSRRVTRRVALVAEATARVGTGDLDVQVPTAGDDEIGELTKAFNTMVRDLRESRGRIEYLQRIGAWQDFARRLAHEIKNPLTPIQLAMQEVHRSYRGDDAAYRLRLDDALSIVEEEVATLRRLVGEFSAFAKLPQASLEPADLGEWLRDSARALQSLPEELGAADKVNVHCDAAHNELPVRIDAMMLKRAVDNLVRNAIQALTADSSQKSGEVFVSVNRDDGFAVLDVSDNGPGVADEDRARIFDPYYTTKSEGTGLGLAIVKKVVLEHGGEIECVPSMRGGASFVIRVPLQAANLYTHAKSP